MAPTKVLKGEKLPVAADHDVLAARIDAAIARQERIVQSWMTRFGRPTVAKKTQAELEAEDAELYRLEPPHLGLGAPVPKEFLDGDVKRKDLTSANDKLRRLLIGKNANGHSAPKPRADAATMQNGSNAKRARRDESSDEEEGRSGLGRAKKAKSLQAPTVPAIHPAAAAAAASSSPAKDVKKLSEIEPVPKPKLNIPLQRPTKKIIQEDSADESSDLDDDIIQKAVSLKKSRPHGAKLEEVDEKEAARRRKEVKRQRKKDKKAKKKAGKLRGDD